MTPVYFPTRRDSGGHNLPFSEEEYRASFFARVAKSDDGCWQWIGAKHRNGYGQAHRNGKPDRAHRVSWRIHFGEIPVGLFVLHRCDVKDCVNPSHLFLGTQSENMRDMMAKGRYRKGSTKNVPRGSRHWLAKLDEQKVLEIKRLHALGYGQVRLGKMFGVTREAIRAILRGWAWKHVVS
jgi:hypothetical protein